MQSLWSTHRKAKLNLNAPAPLPSNTPLETPPLEDADQPPALENPGTSIPPTSSTTPATNEVTSPDIRPPSSKRKLRTARSTAEDSGKRPKLSALPMAKVHTPPATRLSDLGGVEGCVEKMLELVAMPLGHPEIYLHTGVQPPRGVLLHGPPGCGKTLLANAIAGVSVTTVSFVIRLIVCRSWVFPSSAYPLPPSYLACLESRKRRYGTHLTRPRYVS